MKIHLRCLWNTSGGSTHAQYHCWYLEPLVLLNYLPWWSECQPVFNPPWKFDPWLHLDWNVSLLISWLQGKMTIYSMFVFQHCFRNYMLLKSSPSTVLPLGCLWCLGSSGDLFCPFSRWSCIYLWLSHRKDVGKHSALTACWFLVCLHWFSFFPFCWSCKID